MLGCGYNSGKRLPSPQGVLTCISRACSEDNERSLGFATRAGIPIDHAVRLVWPGDERSDRSGMGLSLEPTQEEYARNCWAEDTQPIVFSPRNPPESPSDRDVHQDTPIFVTGDSFLQLYNAAGKKLKMGAQWDMTQRGRQDNSWF